MEASLYNLKGEKIGTVALPDNIFAVRWNADLVRLSSSAQRAEQQRVGRALDLDQSEG